MKTLSTGFAFAILTLMSGVAGATDLFSAVTTAYDQGSLPSQAEVQGWWSGQCYFKGEVAATGAQALIAEPVGTGFNVAVIGSVNLPNDLFSTMTPSTAAAVENFIAGSDFQREVSRTANKSLISNSAANELWVRKANGGFSVEVISYRADKSFTIEAACQFSTKIHN